ncbi:aldo/keto reductase [Prosthecodimorpha staleyi]|uniref:Aldo/keto reductase n=1 Tax=Prosthecodimorpha staleyi TaxID=2840188 RepID=A0A947D360_9HYPH|nr:aldo/keto reductase [Prosthecodimorpha staleyi]MBT9290128.1 aldo/keto reductase [Prosthecodimorpha staleyi]
MKYTRLGRTGLEVSRICLGCMTYGDPTWRGWNWVLTEEQARPFIVKALELGITMFDTADYYSGGESERIVGRALKDYARREDVVIATKVCLPMNDRPNGKGLSRKHIMEGIDASLKRLGTDYVDLYQIHRFDYATPIEETLDALNDVVKAGKALYLGASSMWARQFARMVMTQRAKGWAEFVSMQNFYNLAYREEEREMIPFCQEEGIGLIPWSPLARGFLAGNRPKDGEASTRAKVDTLAQGYFGTEQDYRVKDRLDETAAKLGLKPTVLALAWVLARDGLTAPIVGASKPYHLDDAVAALDVTLDAETIAALEEPYAPRPVQGHQ